MGTALESHFVQNCNNVREAYDKVYAQCAGYAEFTEGYSGTIADCDPPSVVSGPQGQQTVSERIEELFDTLGKRDSCGFYTDGGVMLVYAAPE